MEKKIEILKVKSVNKVSIRLTNERWFHIVENHNELAGLAFEVLEIVAEPDLVTKGSRGEFLAIKKINKKYLVVVYKEISKKDGFIITAFLTSKVQSIIKKGIIWKKKLSKKQSKQSLI